MNENATRVSPKFEVPNSHEFGEIESPRAAPRLVEEAIFEAKIFAES